MSITRVTEKIAKTTGIDERLNSTYERAFYVHTDSLASENEILLADDGTTAVPDMYSRHPANNNALLSNKTARQHAEQPLLWEVVCRYSTITPDPSLQSRTPEEILQEEPTVQMTTERIRVTVHVDKDGNDILNSAGDRFFDPAPEGDEIIRVYTIGFNSAYYSEASAMDFIDKVNSDNFTIGDLVCVPRTLLMHDISANLRFSKGWRYFHITMVLKYRKRIAADDSVIGWDDEFQQRGLCYLPGGTGPRKRIKEGGSDVVEAKLLKADGDVLPDGDPAVYKVVERLKETAFADLLTFCRDGMTNLDLITIFEAQDDQ